MSNKKVLCFYNKTHFVKKNKMSDSDFKKIIERLKSYKNRKDKLLEDFAEKGGKNKDVYIECLKDLEEKIKSCQKSIKEIVENKKIMERQDETDKVDTSSTNILSVNYWKNSKTFKSIKDKETQIKYYKRMNSCEEVLQLVDLESKPFGTESEKIIQEIFELGPRTSSQNDGTRNGKKIEIKSARYWSGKDDCVWQHLEPEHDYEIALLVLLDFHGWKVWGIKKSLLMGEMREKKIVTFQGKQGWWVRKSSIQLYLTPINSISELDTFIQSY